MVRKIRRNTQKSRNKKMGLQTYDLSPEYRAEIRSVIQKLLEDPGIPNSDIHAQTIFRAVNPKMRPKTYTDSQKRVITLEAIDLGLNANTMARAAKNRKRTRKK